MILSIDVGRKNFGVCVLDAEATICRWSLEEVPKKFTAKEFYDFIRPVMTDDITDVVIESQPGKNVTMRRIQYYSEMLAVGLGKHVCVMDARTKLAYAATTPWWKAPTDRKLTYRERKLAAVFIARHIVEDHPVWNRVFEQAKKRDDLADALLQGLAYHNTKKKKEEGAANTAHKPSQPDVRSNIQNVVCTTP